MLLPLDLSSTGKLKHIFVTPHLNVSFISDFETDLMWIQNPTMKQ